MKKEGALRMRFLRHGGIYRSDVLLRLLTPGRGSRFPVGPVPGYRTRRKERALPIVRDEFRPAIPRWVARPHCPSPLHRQDQDKTFAVSNGIIYHRTVPRLLTVCLSRGDKSSRERVSPVGEPLRHLSCYFMFVHESLHGKRQTMLSEVPRCRRWQALVSWLTPTRQRSAPAFPQK
jgi:hypothetical protein